MKTISCRDMGVDCPWVGEAETEEELVQKAKEHAMNEHREYWEKNMKDVPDEEMKKRMRPYIKEK